LSVSRRRLLLGGLAGAGLAGAGFAGAGRARAGLARPGLARPGLARTVRANPAHAASCRCLAFLNLQTNEQLDIEYFRDGEYLADGQLKIQHMLRDFRNGEVHAIDPALLDYLVDVAAKLGKEPRFGVISGYRSPATHETSRERSSSGVAQRSLHVQGRAIDVRMAGIDCAVLASHAQDLQRGGVGYYRASDFVHLDTGALRSWRG
jgi:uncharacterized protein YcbK (DUF882 family)